MDPSGSCLYFYNCFLVCRVKYYAFETFITDPVNSTPGDNRTCGPLHELPFLPTRLYLLLKCENLACKVVFMGCLCTMITAAFGGELKELCGEGAVAMANTSALQLKATQTLIQLPHGVILLGFRCAC